MTRIAEALDSIGTEYPTLEPNWEVVTDSGDFEHALLRTNSIADLLEIAEAFNLTFEINNNEINVDGIYVYALDRNESLWIVLDLDEYDCWSCSDLISGQRYHVEYDKAA